MTTKKMLSQGKFKEMEENEEEFKDAQRVLNMYLQNLSTLLLLEK